MTRPLLIGLMLSKSDRDIIEEVMVEYCKQFDTIFCIESSDDDSIDVISSFDKVEYAVRASDIGINTAFLKDGVRQLLLSRIQDKYGYEGWIFPIHSDEIYNGAVEHLTQCASDEQANVVNAMIAHFVLRQHEMEEIPECQSIQDTRRWYFLGQCEVAGFKNSPGLYYNFFEHMRVLPHGFHPVVTCTRVIIRKHYNLRHPQQIEQRIRERVETGWQPAYAQMQNCYVEDPVDVITAGQVYSPLTKYEGRFVIPEEWEGRIVE